MGGEYSKAERFKKFVASESSNRVLTLPDGSKISYCSFGPVDGHPVFFIPGITGIRFMLYILLRKVEGKSFRFYNHKVEFSGLSGCISRGQNVI